MRSQRYEHKFLIDEALARKVCISAAAYVAPDPFAARFEGYSYPISSLYLDAPDLRLFQETVDGQKQRFKLRVRSYSDDPTTPLHFEVKRRNNGVVEKLRCAVPREQGYALLECCGGDLACFDTEQQAALSEFFALVADLGAQPQVLVRYDREAYVGLFDSELRLTFDRRLRTSLVHDYSVEVQRDDFLRVGDDRVVVEFKFHDRVPAWMNALAQRYGLERRSFSKYGHSMERALEGRDAGRERR